VSDSASGEEGATAQFFDEFVERMDRTRMRRVCAEFTALEQTRKTEFVSIQGGGALMRSSDRLTDVRVDVCLVSTTAGTHVRPTNWGLYGEQLT
jgi:hypothetical protein